MQQEIRQFGPITCGIVATAGLRGYRAGVYEEQLDNSIPVTHEVSVVGWGVDQETKVKYWVVRNSWGTWWGQYGYMHLE